MPLNKMLENLAIFIFIIWVTICVMMAVSSCTISFQTISTRGTANDLIDENQDAKADLTANVPIKPI